jgi:hypothetical protein
MTRTELKQQLQLHFNNSVYYTDQDMNDSIQDGIDEVAAFSGCIWAAAAVPFSANVTYYDMLTLLPNYIGVISIFNDTTNRWMSPTSLRKLGQERADWDAVGGTPEFFAPINHRYVAIYRKPLGADYGRMLVFYRAAAPTLVDQTQIPIPAEHIAALEDYNITDLWEQAQEWGKASTAFKEYVKDLDSLRVAMRNKRNSDRLMSLKG